MQLSRSKKSSLTTLPFLRKRLRRITSIGLHHLTVRDWKFAVHFTLHRFQQTVAFFTSETIHNERSPEWSALQFPASVHCLQEFYMRVWITSGDVCRLFLTYDIALDDSLVPDAQKSEMPRQTDCLWFDMFGYRFTDYDDQQAAQLVDDQQHFSLVKSYNRSSIVRMMNIVQAIHLEEQRSNACLQRIETYHQQKRDYLSKIKERECQRLRIKHLKQCLITQTSTVRQRIFEHEERRKCIEDRRRRLDVNLSRLTFQQEELDSALDQLNQSKSDLSHLRQLISYRQKALLQEVSQSIYPIECDKQNEYSIVNLKLPVANDPIYQTSSNRDKEIKAAVRYCSHFVLIISRVLHLPLRYPIEYHGASTVRIFDYTLNTTEFLLDPSFDLSGFRYGLYLLNRNIGQILHHCHIATRRTDYRRTLENLRMFIELYVNSHSYQPLPSDNDSRLSTSAVNSKSIRRPVNDRLRRGVVWPE